MTASPPTITPQSTMAEVLQVYPGAQRALFRRFHIGGCSNCAFQPTETVASLCERNGGLNPQEVLEHIREVGKDSETIDVIYVVTDKGEFVDDIRIREILLASPDKHVGELIDNRFIALHVNDDQEEANQIFKMNI